VADLVGQFRYTLGEVGKSSVVVAESPAEPRSCVTLFCCSTDESSQFPLGERSGHDGMTGSGQGCSAAVTVARWRGRAVETDGCGWLVDPGAGDGFGDDLGCRTFVVEDHEGLVAGAAASERDVDAAGAGGPVKEQEAAVDGASLGSVARLRVSQLDVGGDIVGGQRDPACSPGDGEAAAEVDGLHGPAVTVLTMRARSVSRVRSLRRVPTRSPAYARLVPTFTERLRRSISPAAMRSCWASSLSTSTLARVGAIITAVSPA